MQPPSPDLAAHAAAESEVSGDAGRKRRRMCERGGEGKGEEGMCERGGEGKGEGAAVLGEDDDEAPHDGSSNTDVVRQGPAGTAFRFKSGWKHWLEADNTNGS